MAEDEDRRLLMTESGCFRFVVEVERLSTGEGNTYTQTQTGSGISVIWTRRGFVDAKLLLIPIQAGLYTF